MKLERLHESFLARVIILGALLLAIFLGSAAGSGRLGMVGMALGSMVAIGFLLILRERIWILIPAVWMLSGQIKVLPLPFSVAHLGILFAFSSFLVLKAFKIVRLKPKFDLLDFMLGLMLVYLATVFMRNPVGVEALGSERVGGRPYFNVLIACCGFWVLARATASARQATFLPLIILAGHAFDAVLNVIAYRIPATMGILSKLYSGLSAETEQDVYNMALGQSGRKTYLVGVSSTSFLAACSFWRPFTMIDPRFIGRVLVALLCLVGVLLSGFRSALFSMGLTFLVAAYLRHGAWAAGRTILLGVLALGFLLVVQGRVVSLPFAAQRALSFLPGEWDYAAKSDAQGSTEWRVEMWKAMLAGNRYISNKWLGDGFGFTRQQLQMMNSNIQTGLPSDIQENFLISGSVHSGPVSTIRFVGYVGLAIFMVLLILLAVRAGRLIQRARDTPFFPLALFIGIPGLLTPFNFVFIFGAFEGDLPAVIFTLGMLKMLGNSLDAFETKRDAAPLIPMKSSSASQRPPPTVATAGSSRFNGPFA